MKNTSKSLLADFSSLSITKENELKTIGGQEIKLWWPTASGCTDGDEDCCDEDPDNRAYRTVVASGC